MKKLSILLLAAVMIFTCFALAACGDDGDTSSASNTSTTASDDKSNASSTSSTSSEATSSDASSDAASSDTSTDETTSDETSDPDTSDTSGGEVATGDPEVFWVTHYDSYTEEGAGMILTEDCDYSSWDGAWCDHYAFKPIDGVENGYELVELSYGTIANGDATYNGSGKALKCPEGGFVYATSIGNNYTSEGIDASKPDYVNESCNGQISRCRTWKVGDKFVVTGVDLSGKTVPKSSGDDIQWYQSGYSCTATIAPLS